MIERGDDSISGGTQNDRIVDWSGANTLNGDDGQDTLDGSSHDHLWDLTSDQLFGGTTRDNLIGDYGDTLTGGLDKGDDFFLFGGGTPIVITDARSEAQAGVEADEIMLMVPTDANFDVAAWIGTGANGKDATLVIGNTTLATFTGEAGQQLNISVVEVQASDVPGWGGTLDDSLKGTAGGDLMFGGLGDDRINATSGADFVNDGWGNDWVSLGDEADYFVGADDASTHPDADDIHGGRGSDVIWSQTGADTVHGDDGSDSIEVLDLPFQGGADVVSGGRGDDTISADTGDTVSGDSGHDQISVLATSTGVLVKDFDPDQDVLDLWGSAGTLTLETASNGTDVLVEVDGVTVVTLRNVDLADLVLGDNLIF